MAPKLNMRTLERIAKHLNGDWEFTGYRSGPQLVSIFRSCGLDDVYGPGFPSRGQYTDERIASLNGEGRLDELLDQMFDRLEYRGGAWTIEQAANDLNVYLARDGVELSPTPNGYVLHSANSLVGDTIPIAASPSNARSINENWTKSTDKIAARDYSGAITNARSFLEAVLLDILGALDPSAKKYDGDLPRLFNTVIRGLGSDPGAPGMTPAQRQMVGGLVSVVNGVSSTRNEMSDAHASTYDPEAEEAVLVVNAVRTISSYVVWLANRRQ